MYVHITNVHVFTKMCMFHKEKCMHLDEKEDLVDLVNSCSIYSLEPLMLMDGRTLDGISMKWPPMEIVNIAFVGWARGKGIGFGYVS